MIDRTLKLWGGCKQHRLAKHSLTFRTQKNLTQKLSLPSALLLFLLLVYFLGTLTQFAYSKPVLGKDLMKSKIFGELGLENYLRGYIDPMLYLLGDMGLTMDTSKLPPELAVLMDSTTKFMREKKPLEYQDLWRAFLDNGMSTMLQLKQKCMVELSDRSHVQTAKTSNGYSAPSLYSDQHCKDVSEMYRIFSALSQSKSFPKFWNTKDDEQEKILKKIKQKLEDKEYMQKEEPIVLEEHGPVTVYTSNENQVKIQLVRPGE